MYNCEPWVLLISRIHVIKWMIKIIYVLMSIDTYWENIIVIRFWMFPKCSWYIDVKLGMCLLKDHKWFGWLARYFIIISALFDKFCVIIVLIRSRLSASMYRFWKILWIILDDWAYDYFMKWFINNHWYIFDEDFDIL